MTTLVIMPTYNEREALPTTLAHLRQTVPEVDVLVVDDSSPDGTGEWADRATASDSQVHVLHRAGKEGLGRAYLDGFRWAMERGYDTVVEMDADGSHRPEDLPALLTAARSEPAPDLVIGSRWVPGGSVVNWPWTRQLISKVGTGYARLALRLTVRDATAGFRVYPARTLRRLPLGEVESQGYCFQIDMTWRVQRARGRVIEVPITFVERTQGRSKMSRAIALEAITRLTEWGLDDRRRRIKLRIEKLAQALRRRA
ncbi:polyprenol monophosphomannose synthase [Pseudactinotalea terrae]|uniref:polyprenol monophosphomannose synthase n=1 Tax=Pseudactinotalea terrae TaxID=1743262 RepID=UPI0012E15F76|nr:polyprenol monophosphomannose synthase [Pseudactinotalea terrae]